MIAPNTCHSERSAAESKNPLRRAVRITGGDCHVASLLAMTGYRVRMHRHVGSFGCVPYGTPLRMTLFYGHSERARRARRRIPSVERSTKAPLVRGAGKNLDFCLRGSRSLLKSAHRPTTVIASQCSHWCGNPVDRTEIHRSRPRAIRIAGRDCHVASLLAMTGYRVRMHRHVGSFDSAALRSG